MTLHAQETEQLSDLATDLEEQLRFRTTLTSDQRHQPVLVIHHPSTSALHETVRVQGGLYIWSWGQTIASVDERDKAVQLIGRVLAVVET